MPLYPLDGEEVFTGQEDPYIFESGGWGDDNSPEVNDVVIAIGPGGEARSLVPFAERVYKVTHGSVAPLYATSLEV